MEIYEERIEDEIDGIKTGIKTLFDYDKEYDKIENRQLSNFLKLDVGVHRILIMSEPEKTFYTNPEDKKITEQIKLIANYENKQYEWCIPVGVTDASLYGQLLYVGKMQKGLKGKLLEVVVSTMINRKGETVKKYQLLNYVRLKQGEARKVAELI